MKSGHDCTGQGSHDKKCGWRFLFRWCGLKVESWQMDLKSSFLGYFPIHPIEFYVLLPWLNFKTTKNLTPQNNVTCWNHVEKCWVENWQKDLFNLFPLSVSLKFVYSRATQSQSPRAAVLPAFRYLCLIWSWGWWITSRTVAFKDWDGTLLV